MSSFNILSIEDLTGKEVWEETIEVTEAWIKKFIDLTGDIAPVHTNQEHANAMGYAGKIAHGLLVTSMFSRILGMHLPGKNTVLHQVTTQMKGPVFIGDKLHYTVAVSKLVPSVKTVALSLKVVNQSGTLINSGEATCLFRMK